MPELLAQLATVGELVIWQQVPELVKLRYKAAADVQRAIGKVLKYLPPMQPGYGQVYWHPETKTVWFVSGDGDDEQTVQKWHNSFAALPGIDNVKCEAEYGPHNDPDWIKIKKASAFSWLNKPYQLAGKLTGGPSPLSNAIVSGLLGSGLGYAGGTVAENLLPEDYLERGRLRKLLAVAGGAVGAASHVPQAFANAAINQKATGKPHWLRSIVGGDQYQQLSPHEPDWRDHYYRGKKASIDAAFNSLRLLPQPHPFFLASTTVFTKTAMAFDTGVYGSPVAPLRPVPVDAFNNAIWNDVHNGTNSSQSNIYGTRSPYSDNTDTLHTPPVHAAAATGLVSGIQQMYGNRPLLSPMHFINGLTHAGLDLATARVAGGVLGALGGLTPAAQKQLQQLGIWSGMIRGVTGSVLGLQ